MTEVLIWSKNLPGIWETQKIGGSVYMIERAWFGYQVFRNNRQVGGYVNTLTIAKTVAKADHVKRERPKVVTTQSTALGVRCWSAYRFAANCHACDRYDTCKLGERVANIEYDLLLAEARSMKLKSDQLFKAAKAIQ